MCQVWTESGKQTESQEECQMRRDRKMEKNKHIFRERMERQKEGVEGERGNKGQREKRR